MSLAEDVGGLGPLEEGGFGRDGPAAAAMMGCKTEVQAYT